MNRANCRLLPAVRDTSADRTAAPVVHVARSGRGVSVRGPPVAPEGRRVGASHEEARTRRRRLVGALLSLSLSISGCQCPRRRLRASNVGRAICSAFDQMGPVGPRDRPQGANARARGPAPSRTRMLRQANAGAPPPVCRRGARKAGSNPGQPLFFQKMKSKSKSIPTKTRCV